MIETVILDLDGPVLDGKLRHYACYRQILIEHGYEPLSLDSYWQMKRQRVGVRQQLEASGAGAIYEDFAQSWLDRIEQPDLLILDQVQPGMVGKVQQWRKQGLQLILATLRRYPEYVHNQLRWLGLDIYFDHVAVCDHSQGGPGKAQRIRSLVIKTPPEHCLWIGDSEVDVEGARAFGCPIWVVTCGVRGEAYLRSLLPDFLSNDLVSVDLESCYGA